MLEFDLSLKAMGLYKYLIYLEERALLIQGIEINRGLIKQKMKDILYYRHNIDELRKKLENNCYEG